MIWKIILRGAIQGLIVAIQKRVGKEVVDVMQAAIALAASSALSGAAARAEATAYFIEQVKELNAAVYEEIVSGAAEGLPSILNLLMEALLQRAKLLAPAQPPGEK